MIPNMQSREVRIFIFWFRIFVIAFVLATLLGIWYTTKAADDLMGKPIANTAEAVGWALADLATLGETDRPFVRYIWIPPWGNESWIDAINFDINTAISHSRIIQLGVPIANGWMLRYDLRRLAPDQKQFEVLRNVWDSLASQDPYFHVPEVVSGEKKIVIAPHLIQREAIAVTNLSLSSGAIYRADFFNKKVTTTLEGGKYYDFLQIPQQSAVPEGKTQQQVWLESLGIFEDISQNLGADQRSAIFRSGVTGKPRRIDVLYGVGRGGNIGTITRDISDEDVEVEKHPLRNLLDAKETAREIIIERFNGMHAFVLTNNQGVFQKSVPDNIAHDTTIPSPHTKRLQPAISCIRCHGPFDGFIPFGNDVQKITKSNVNIFTDLSKKDEIFEILEKLTSLYAGQLDIPDGPIGRARRDYSASVYKIVQNNPFIADEKSVVSYISEQVGEIEREYWYDLVTPEKACSEFGLEVPEGKGIEGLKQLLPLGADIPLTFSAGALLSGVSINRRDFEFDYPDMALAIAKKNGYKPTIQSQTKSEPQSQTKPESQTKTEPEPEPKPEPQSQSQINDSTTESVVVNSATLPKLDWIKAKVLLVESVSNNQPISRNKWSFIYTKEVVEYLDKNTEYVVWNKNSPQLNSPEWVKQLLKQYGFEKTPWIYAELPSGKVISQETPKNPREIISLLEGKK